MAGEPQLAASDLAIKLDFQKKQLDRKVRLAGTLAAPMYT